MNIRSQNLAGVSMLLLVLIIGAPAQAAGKCPDIAYGSENAKLRKLLVSTGFSRSERSFLLGQIDSRVGKITKSRLNARGAECGVKTVRAMVVGCLNHTLPGTLKAVPVLDRKTRKTFWGKANVTSREAAFIGMYHVCHASAADALLSR